MYKNLTNRFFGYFFALAALLLMYPQLAEAKPAKRNSYTANNPDGTTVTLIKTGDEFFHCILTEDGYPVQKGTDGWYHIVADNGTITEIRAYNPTERSEVTKAMMKTVTPQIAYTSLQEIALADSKLYQSSKKAAMQMQINRAADNEKESSTWDKADGHDIRKFPSEGLQKVLIILVNFQNKKFSFCQDPKKEIENCFNQEGYSNYKATGSTFDYFKASSGGKFTPEFDVYGPVELKNNYQYYGRNDYNGNDQKPCDMVLEALKSLDDAVDFSEYDRDHNGIVDNVYVIYAGNGEADTYDDDTIWPHSWHLEYGLGYFPTFDNVKFSTYACSSELNGDDEFDGIGTFCHEFSHVLGLPDLYATDYRAAMNLTPGAFSIMDVGPYNNNGHTPPIYSAYEKYAMEWLNPTLIETNREVTLAPLTRLNQAFKIKSNNKDTEYFLFENRLIEGWDIGIPASGMLVWHIDYKKSEWDYNSVNCNAQHQYVDIVEADGVASADKGADTFPGSVEAFDFDPTTKPKFLNWNNRTTGYSINSIEQRGDGSITFNVVKEDSDETLILNEPKVRYSNITSDGIEIEWDAVEDADNYLLTVYPLEEGLLPTEPVNNFHQTYRMEPIGNTTKASLTNLDQNTIYYIGVNAVLKKGVSRPGAIYVNISDKIATTTQTFVKSIDGTDVELGWNEVAGADRYRVSVVQREQTHSSTTAEYGFDDAKMPAGWEYVGKMDYSETNCGKTAPSVKFTHQADFIQSEIFDNDITKLQFELKADSDNPRGRIEVYGTYADGSMEQISNLDITKQGTQEIDFPAGFKRFTVYYFYTKKKQSVYIDDIAVTTIQDYTDTPVPGYDKLEVEENSLNVTGLEPFTEYTAYASAVIDGKETNSYKAVNFTTGESGVSEISSNQNLFTVQNGTIIPLLPETKYSIFTIDGVIVAANVTGNYTLPTRGLYIIHTDKNVSKLRY